MYMTPPRQRARLELRCVSQGFYERMSEKVKAFIVSLLDGTPSAAFVPGRKIVITIRRDGSAWVEFEPGLRSTRLKGVEPDSQASQSHSSRPLESSGHRQC